MRDDMGSGKKENGAEIGDEQVTSFSDDDTAGKRRDEDETTQENHSSGFADLEKVNSEMTMHLHNLMNYGVGKSKVEFLAAKIEKRRQERIPVTFNVRVEFLKTCRAIAVAKGYENKTTIHYMDLLEYRRRVKQKFSGTPRAHSELNNFHKYWRIINDRQCLLDALNHAVKIVEKIQVGDDDWFHYQEFNFFHTRLVSRWPWRRHSTVSAVFTIFFFYLFSPIVFCTIMKDRGVCPVDAEVPGWVSTLYFASTTMSTVGYGDLTVEKNKPWKVFIGLLYMIVATYVALTSFSAAAETAFSPIKSMLDRFLRVQYTGPFKDGEYLYQRVRKIKLMKYTEIIISAIIMNLIFVFAARIFFRVKAPVNSGLDWMDSFYVAVQTTTTIGYGDFVIPAKMRWFQILYLTLSPYLTGSALSMLGTLYNDLENARRYHAWNRRDVNKHMIHYLSSTNDPTRVDQFEFAIASLLDLGKITADDLSPIMDKYRYLAERSGNSGYIEVNENLEESEMGLENLEKTEGAEGT